MSTIVDGKAIAAELKRDIAARVREFPAPPSIAVFAPSGQPTTGGFVGIKKRFAEEVGIRVEIHGIIGGGEAGGVAEQVRAAGADGVIVQLPLPPRIDVEEVLRAIPVEKDIDAVSPMAQERFESGENPVLPPVVAAIEEILSRHGVEVAGTAAAVIGRGRLVGGPAAVWFSRQGAEVSVLDKGTRDIARYTQAADILVLGAGVPGLVTPDMITEGVVLLDAGTSEAAGKFAGDADPACAEKASLFTPVPGGIGPVTVAKIFENLLVLAQRRQGGSDLQTG